MDTLPVVREIDFHGHQLLTTMIDNVIWVAMKPIVVGIGLDWTRQNQKLQKSKDKFNYRHMPIVAQDGKQRAMGSIPHQKLNAWLYSINPEKVKPEIRERVILYQEESSNVLYQYWQHGEAINPRYQDDDINSGFDLDQISKKLDSALKMCNSIGLYGRPAIEKALEILKMDPGIDLLKVLNIDIPHRISAKPKKAGYVYAIKSDTGLVKIGQSTRPKTRVKNAATGGGHIIVDQFVSEAHINYQENERKLMDAFKPFRKKGEWFYVDFNEAVMLLKSYYMNETKQVESELDITRFFFSTLNNLLDSKKFYIEMIPNQVDHFEVDLELFGYDSKSDKPLPDGKRIGWFDMKYIYLDGNKTYSAISEFSRDNSVPFSMSVDFFYKQLKEKKLIVPDVKERRIRKQKVISGVRHRLIWIDIKNFL